MESAFLSGEKVYLRPMSNDDIEYFMKWYNDYDTRGKIGETRPSNTKEIERCVNRNGHDCAWFTIVEKDTNKVIGETGLLRMFPDWRTTDLTIIIPDKKDQGKGYGTDTIKLLMNYAFGYLNYNRIAIGVVGFNANALEFYKKVGFKQEGIQEQGYYYNYKYYDFVMMRILKEEFVTMYNIEI